MPRFVVDLPRRVTLLVLLAGSALITASSLAYFDFDRLPPFVIEKLPVRYEALWLFSLRVHVAAASLALPACLALATRALQRRATLHRWLGRAAGVLVLFALVPSGAVLAFDAKGGRVTTAGFLLSGAIVAGFMVRGILHARRRDLAAHRRDMLHVLGQMSVAVSSRALLLGFDAAGVDPDLAYVVALWVPVLFSAAMVEALAFRVSPLRPLVQTLFERIRREPSSLAARLRVRALSRSFSRLGG